MPPNPSPSLATSLRSEFPPLTRPLRPGVPLVYLDSAATALKPRAVIEAERAYNEDYPANVHRGLHELSERASAAFEEVRESVARFLGAMDPAEVIFTSGTTASINLVAQSWGRDALKPGDEILLTILEHHANIVPWQMAARRAGASLRYVSLTEDGQIDLDDLERQLSSRTRLVAISGMSNVLGTIPPVREIARRARAAGALTLIDGAQSVPHGPTDVAALGIDFLAFSGHKLYGPTGVGVLWGRRDILERMEPWQGGGGMISRVGLEASEWNDLPWKFEAGTPPIGPTIGLGAAIQFLERLDHDKVVAHERRLTALAHERLGEMPGVRIVGPGPSEKGGIVSFDVDGVHPHDLAQLLDRDGVAIRAGHHCAMPLHKHLGLSATARASFAIYNNEDDVEALVRSVERARSLFRRPVASFSPKP